MNEAEEFVSHYCRRSFLSLWSYANPLRKRRGNELCDFLVVCDPDVIIVSVKDISLSNTGDAETDWTRWRREAVEASVRQIYGAERTLSKTSTVTTKEGGVGLRLPEKAARCIHRIAVALGGQGKVPFSSKDFGKGYVHVLDGRAFEVVVGELDTIADFVAYLKAKEELHKKGAMIFQEGGGEEDLLADYLWRNRSFPDTGAPIIMWLGPGLWKTLVENPAWAARKAEDKESYLWDSLIEALSIDYLEGRLTFDAVDGRDLPLRAMAREDRLARRLLSKALAPFVAARQGSQVPARIFPQVPGRTGATYVFIACPIVIPPEARKQELQFRCFVARGKYLDSKTVIGVAVAIEGRESHIGPLADLSYVHLPEWSDERSAIMDEIQRKFGYFATTRETRSHEDEYPKRKGTNRRKR